MLSRESRRRRDAESDRFRRGRFVRVASPLRDSRYLNILYNRPHYYRTESSLSVRNERERRRRTPTPPRRFRRPIGDDAPPRQSSHRPSRRRKLVALSDARPLSRDHARREKLPTKRLTSPNSCLGVFGLSCHTSSEDLRRHFARWGAIKDAQVMTSRGFDYSGGFGYVLYHDVENATQAKKHMANKLIDGMKLRIEYSNALSDSYKDSKTMTRALEVAKRYCFGATAPTTLPFVLPPAFHPATAIVQAPVGTVYAAVAPQSLTVSAMPVHLPNIFPSQYPNSYLT